VLDPGNLVHARMRCDGLQGRERRSGTLTPSPTDFYLFSLIFPGNEEITDLTPKTSAQSASWRIRRTDSARAREWSTRDTLADGVAHM